MPAVQKVPYWLYYLSKKENVKIAVFELALQMVLFHENGFVDNPYDLGGCTNLGISLKFYRGKVKPDATLSDIRDLTVNEAADIYERFFWSRAPFNEINNQTLCNRVFDLAVNMGTAHAIGCLQRAINNCINSHLVIDGILGPATLQAVNSIPAETLYNELIMQAASYYHDIVNNNSQENKFLKGWLTRLYSAPI